MTKGSRIKELRSLLGSNGKSMTLEEFGKPLGVSKNTISNIENGNRGLTNQMCKSICHTYNVSEDWLLEGKEPIFRSSNGDVASKFASANGLDKMEETLIREYLKLTDGDRAIFRKYLKNVLSELNGIATAADQRRKEIDQKVEEYREELEAEANSDKSEASQTGSEDITDEA